MPDDGTILFGDDESEPFDGVGSETLGTIGPYRLEEVIGEGGMGIVYRAEQEEPVRRTVALKLVRPGMDSKTVLNRFASEAQALALMSHPNIAKMYRADRTPAGRTYFAMEYCPGESITDYCDGGRLNARARIELFLGVCNGVQHAHQKGIIHRDLKPSNVLVIEQDGRPVPKIIDFGLSKATDKSFHGGEDQTIAGQVIGTPTYMSPEQAKLGAVDVDTRTDVYSMGVLLYQLLVGFVPFLLKVTTLDELLEMRRRILEEDAKRPSEKILFEKSSSEMASLRGTEPGALARQLKGDLDWVVMKAMAKDRDLRYETPTELKNDLRHYLNFEPVEARPPSRTYQLRKLVRRHLKTVIAVVAVFIALLAGVTVSTSLYLEAERARTAKEKAENETEQVRMAAEQENQRIIDETMSSVKAALTAADESVGKIQRLRDAMVGDEFETALKSKEIEALESQCMRMLQVAVDRAIEAMTVPTTEDYRRQEGARRASEASYRLFEFASERGFAGIANRAGEVAVSYNRGRNPEIDRVVAGVGVLSVRTQAKGLTAYLFRFERAPEGSPYEYRRVLVPVATEGLLTGRGPGLNVRGGVSQECWADFDLTSVGMASRVEIGERVPAVRWEELVESSRGEGGGDRFASCRLPGLPMDRVPIAMGSYLLIARAPGNVELRLPFMVWRNGEVELDLRPIEASVLPEGFVYIPGGISLAFGGEMETAFYESQRQVSVESFFIKKSEVTVGEYSDFVSARLEGGASIREVQSLLPTSSQGKLLWDLPSLRDEGIVPSLPRDHPVASLNVRQASAYCRWLSREMGRRVRLPTEEEWERAARGADGRNYPWGDLFLPSFCLMFHSSEGKIGESGPVLSFVGDQSVFGVFDLAGSVAEYCGPVSDEVYDGERLGVSIARGGYFGAKKGFQCSSTIRLRRRSDDVSQFIGFRLALDEE